MRALADADRIRRFMAAEEKLLSVRGHVYTAGSHGGP